MFRRDSEVMKPDAPITPPMSPSHSEEGGDNNAIIVDTERRFSGMGVRDPDPDPALMSPESIADNVTADLQEEEDPSAMQVEESDPDPASPPRQPGRLLEDEQVHVASAGALKLTDFEVKGTLGASFV
jgi:hypothetical protein